MDMWHPQIVPGFRIIAGCPGLPGCVAHPDGRCSRLHVFDVLEVNGDVYVLREDVPGAPRVQAKIIDATLHLAGKHSMPIFSIDDFHLHQPEIVYLGFLPSVDFGLPIAVSASDPRVAFLIEMGLIG